MQADVSAQDSVLSGRFAIQSVAGRGGMGTVYQARDLRADRDVAIKILHAQGAGPPGAAELARFQREAHVLASLRHPGIVSYVADGQTPEGLPFLAMEWLHGEDLAARLKRGPLSVAESLALLFAVADALAQAHQHGIVHRDLKPSNLFLREGRCGQAAILDFGVAQWGSGGSGTTRTGMVIGTPEYMAPEQARGQRVITPAADVFALGSVIYHCLTGQSPFRGEHVVATLSSVLFQEPQRLRALCPEAPRALEQLIHCMLAKRAEDRPADARVVLSQLHALRDQGALDEGTPLGGVEPSGAFVGSALLDSEQSLLSVIIAQLPEADTATASGSGSGPAAAPAQPSEPADSLPPPLLHTVQSYGAQVERLVDGSIVLTLSGSGAARDLATQAGRCALVLAKELPHARVALATGRGQVRCGRGVPVGEVVERALELLRLEAQQDAAGSDAPRVLLDPVSSGLLPRRFRIEAQPGFSLLLAEGEEYESRDPDSGRRTDPPCIGRDQELALLDSLIATAIEEPTARAALVISPPGLGKSRLCQEFLMRLAAHHPEAVVLVGRGDPMTTASPHGVLAQALRRLCGLTGKEPPAEQYHKLRQRLGRHLPSPARSHAVATLALLCSVEPTEPLPPAVAAARTSPPQWNQELTHGVCDFIAAECQDHPLVFILEDMHWCDGQTLRLIDMVLHTLRETPLFVLGLARPEVEQLFPGLWAGRVQELRLTGLGKKASERLVRKVLAGSGDDKTITRIVEQAAGNPLYIEELVRAVHEGKGDELPQSMLAMLQARLLRLEPGPRRLLRAASIFGHTFWRGGLLWLLGLRQATSEQAAAVDAWLKLLIDAEIIERHRESRFQSDPEFGFRHVLMREAAYALLTDDDRKLGHGLAALFLEQAGERDQALVAGHTYRIVQYIRQRHSSFAVARLIMLTGLPLKKFTAATPDDPVVLRKIRSALGILLRSDELAELRELFRDTP